VKGKRNHNEISTEEVINREVRSKITLKEMIIKYFKQWDLQIMVVPGLILLFVFAYLPMWGVLIAFKDFKLHAGFMGSAWVGLENFKEFFNDPNFFMIMKNTLGISLAKLIFGFPAPIILALLINEVRCRKFKKVFQTVSYLPHFISWVIVGGLVTQMLSVETGSFNQALESIKVIDEPINWLTIPKYFWTILVSTNVWKDVGYNSIIYLAAIAGIDPGLYEAAAIDGAGKLKQTLKITLPCIAPVITIYLILAISRILNAGFEDILVLTNNGHNAILRNVSEVIDVHVYRYGIQNMRFAYATAVGVFRSIVAVILLVGANQVSKKVSENSFF
jgi:putative aldouronate transport system permease protein